LLIDGLLRLRVLPNGSTILDQHAFRAFASITPTKRQNGMSSHALARHVNGGER
jgi:hypothetical protein